MKINLVAADTLAQIWYQGISNPYADFRRSTYLFVIPGWTQAGRNKFLLSPESDSVT